MTIVIAYIPSPQGEAAIAAAIAEAHWRDEDLVVVNVTRGDAYVDRRFAAQQDISAIEARLTSADTDYQLRQIVGEDPVHGVLAVVKEVDASLLVIGLRHRSPVGKLFMGSAAQQLLIHAPCPVLAVKDPAEEID
ncbi:MAG TPA: universal stress protein [Mycobacterium sp.]